MTKYNAKKTTVDNIPFDSRAEAVYYTELKIRKRKGEIEDFELQPVFILQEKFRKNGKAYSSIKYIADFLVTYPDGRKEVIDVKGVVTDAYSIKRRMFERKFPDLTIKEVRNR